MDARLEHHANFGRYAKERPVCRRHIVEIGLRPEVVNGRWNGLTALDKNGRRTFISDGLKTQLRKMLAEGYWPDLLALPDAAMDALVDLSKRDR